MIHNLLKPICILTILIPFRVFGQDEFVIRKGSDSYYIQGQLEKCYLKENAVVEGYTCTKWIHYYEDGSLRRFTIAEPDTFAGIAFPEKSTLFLKQDGTLEKCWFGKKTDLEDLPLIGGFKNVTIVFYDNGNINCCFLRKIHNIQGLPCEKGNISPVYFYPSGKL
ncbi:MAG: hypothetical protein JSV24_11485, partial [Bacteroidales bacterium]